MFRKLIEFFTSNETPTEFTYISLPILETENPLGKAKDSIKIFKDGSHLFVGLDCAIESKNESHVIVKIIGKTRVEQLDVFRFTKVDGSAMVISTYPYTIAQRDSNQ